MVFMKLFPLSAMLVSAIFCVLSSGCTVVREYTPEQKEVKVSNEEYELARKLVHAFVKNDAKTFISLLPEETRYKYTTMSWAGDVADMISMLLCNGKAFGETFNTSSSEAHTWDEIAQYYHDICNLEAVWIPNDDYLKIVSSDLYWPSALYMLKYSRMFDHIMDNTKILDFCGMKQENMMKL
jgi:hypothetical protein